MSLLVILAYPLFTAAAEPPAPAAAPASPPVTITLHERHGHETPIRKGFTHTGGGNIDVAMPAPDTVVITMTGVAVAGAHPCKDSVASLDFDLDQCFEVVFENKELQKAKLTVEARVIGLLRSHKGGGAADWEPAAVTISSGPTELLTLAVPGHSVSGGDSLSVNDHQGPVSVSVGAGKLTLHQAFVVTAAHPGKWRRSKAASAEFGPDPALDPLWISYWEPFHGANKKDFGFQVTVKVMPQ
ncbi:MAG: hypothetical protein ACJ8FY_18410 [Gemmataceae bacterium]